MTTIQKEGIIEAYEDVRDDNSQTTWLLCKYRGNEICLEDKGENYDDLKAMFGDDERAFAFVRVTMGDELSKRAKFVLITWTGPFVAGLKKAKMSTDKSLVKNVIKSYAVEIMTDEHEDLTMETVKETLKKAGGADYGTGVRD